MADLPERDPQVSSGPPLFARLCRVLARLYETREKSARVVGEAMMNSEQIAFSNRAIDNWFAILDEAIKQGKVDALLDVALKEYGKNAEFTELAQQIKSEPQQLVPPAKSTVAKQKATRFLEGWWPTLLIGAVLLLVVPLVIHSGSWVQLGAMAALTVFGVTLGLVQLRHVYREQERSEQDRRHAELAKKRQPRKAFRGLFPYEKDDQLPGEVRRDEAETLVTQILNGDFTFGVVAGEVGCGKTSFLGSLVLQRLKENEVEVRYVRSARALRKAEAVQRGIHAVVVELEALCAARDGVAPQVLILDQFEELLIDFPKDDDRAELAMALATLLQRVKLVCGLRKDFFLEVTQLGPQIPPLVSGSSSFQLRNFTEREAAQVILHCAAADGIECDPRFAGVLAADLARDDGRVRPPELQIVCVALKGTLQTREYESVGRVSGILSRYIRDVVDACNSPEVGKRVLRALCNLQSAAKEEPQRLKQICGKVGAVPGSSGSSEIIVQAVLELLETARLVVRQPVDSEEPEEPEMVYSLVHDYLVNDVAQATKEESTRTEDANLLLQRFLLDAGRGLRTRIPWAQLRLIKKHASPEAQREAKAKTLLAQSFRGHMVSWGVIGFVVLGVPGGIYGYFAREKWSAQRAERANRAVKESQEAMKTNDVAAVVRAAVTVLENTPAESPIRASAMSMLLNELPVMPKMLADLGDIAQTSDDDLLATLSPTNQLALLRRLDGTLETWDLEQRTQVPSPSVGGEMSLRNRMFQFGAPEVSRDGRFAALWLPSDPGDNGPLETERPTRLVVWAIGENKILVDETVGAGNPAISWGPRNLLLLRNWNFRSGGGRLEGWRFGLSRTPRPFLLEGNYQFSEQAPLEDQALMVIQKTGEVFMSVVNLDRLRTDQKYSDIPPEVVEWNLQLPPGTQTPPFVRWHLNGEFDLNLTGYLVHCSRTSCIPADHGGSSLPDSPPWDELIYPNAGDFDLRSMAQLGDTTGRRMFLSSVFRAGGSWRLGSAPNTIVVGGHGSHFLVDVAARMIPEPVNFWFEPGSFAWTPDGSAGLAIAPAGQAVRLPMRSAPAHEERTLRQGSSEVWNSAFSPDGKYVLVESRGPTESRLEVFSTTEGRLLWDVTGYQGGGHFSTDGSLVGFYSGRTPSEWSLVPVLREAERTTIHMEEYVVALAVSERTQERLLALQGADQRRGTVQIVRVEGSEVHRLCEVGQNEFEMFARDGESFLVRTADALEIRSMTDNQCRTLAKIAFSYRQHDLLELFSAGFRRAKSLQLRPDDSLELSFASGVWTFRHLQHGPLELEFEGRSYAERSVPVLNHVFTVSEDGGRVVALNPCDGISASCARFWDLTGESIVQVRGPIFISSRAFEQLSGQFTPDGTEFLLVDGTGTLRRMYIGPRKPEAWAWATAELFDSLMGFSTSQTNGIAFHPGGANAAAARLRQQLSREARGNRVAHEALAGLDAWCRVQGCAH